MRALALLVVILLTNGCSHAANDDWYGKDKAQHFMLSAIAYAAGHEMVNKRPVSTGRSVQAGFLFSLSLGAGKELWDSRAAGSGWSWYDLAWDIAGASAGYAIWQLAD
ncbi:YfiM family lipoprotein [Apirhabdus apintestini]|uniref:YfiM family lipoprotein n=1 Tax=Erwinia sp. HR93 TaxID=3094840 RepID=UPI002ADED06A|nr:YfiM family lipoprotein [Erwinia sp. HR93]MEA1064269.1 YfiM family lipoprotein [Erwinia sp. HR93]WPM85413.1 YfiM family lipoprotein [Enterobacteriaceae bacterium CA-0114]